MIVYIISAIVSVLLGIWLAQALDQFNLANTKKKFWLFKILYKGPIICLFLLAPFLRTFDFLVYIVGPLGIITLGMLVGQLTVIFRHIINQELEPNEENLIKRLF